MPNSSPILFFFLLSHILIRQAIGGSLILRGKSILHPLQDPILLVKTPYFTLYEDFHRALLGSSDSFRVTLTLISEPVHIQCSVHLNRVTKLRPHHPSIRSHPSQHPPITGAWIREGGVACYRSTNNRTERRRSLLTNLT